MTTVYRCSKRKRHKDPELLASVRVRRCCVCGNPGYSDPSHVRSRGAGGPDTTWNVVPMCRIHHSIWHARGVNHFLFHYPAFELTLQALGWEIVREEGYETKLRHALLLESS